MSPSTVNFVRVRAVSVPYRASRLFIVAIHFFLDQPSHRVHITCEPSPTSLVSPIPWTRTISTYSVPPPTLHLLLRCTLESRTCCIPNTDRTGLGREELATASRAERPAREGSGL